MTLSPTVPPLGTVRDWLQRRAKGGGIALVFPETRDTVTWAELETRARGFAAALVARGIGKGESVAIMAPNSQDGLVALFGALYGGFCATMINLSAGREAIEYALTHCDARVAYVHADCRDAFGQANRAGILPVSLRGASATLPEVSANDTALLMYTSGTTGRPKGVVHSHASLLAGGWTTAIAHDLSSSDRGVLVLPAFHINGLCVTLVGSLVSGGSIAVVSRFSASQFWQQIEDSAATWFSVVPTIISHLLHGSQDPSEGARKRLRFGRSASSALAIETHAAFEARFGLPIVETMGLTETAAQILSNPMPPSPRKIGSPGRACGCEVRIEDSHGNPVMPEVEGEIVVRGPNTMREYLKDPAASAAAFREGWFRTGDLARMDSDGFVFVTGRLKELIIKGGENIAPREIDEALYGHPDVVEAAAFARACPTYGERVEAAVTLRAAARISAAELRALCVSKVGGFKAPDFVHILPELPKGPSGKIQRLKLADHVPNPRSSGCVEK